MGDSSPWPWRRSRRSPKLSTPRRLSRGTLLAIVVAAALAVPTVLIAGPQAASIGLLDGVTWLSSGDDQALVQVNGATGQVGVAAAVPGALSDELEVFQVGDVVGVRDRRTGEFMALDPTGLGFSPARDLADGVDIQPVCRWFVEIDQREGEVQVLDGISLAPVGSPLRLAAPLSRAAVGKQCEVYVGVESTGELAALTPTAAGIERTHTVRVADPKRSLHVVATPSGAAVLDLDRAGEARLTFVAGGRSTASIPVDLPRDPVVALPRSSDGDAVPILLIDKSQLLLVSERGVVATADLQRGHRLGEPVVGGGRVAVPDYTSGEVHLIEPDGSATRVVVPGADDWFQVISDDGRLWLHDPSSGTAIVVDGDGGTRTVDTSAGPANGNGSGQGPPPDRRPSPPSPPPPPPDDGVIEPGLAPPAPVGDLPGPPGRVAATAGNASAQVTWAPPADAGGAPLTGYWVAWQTAGQTAGEATVSADVDRFEATGLVNGQTYRFIVASRNDVGESLAVASNPVTPSPTPLAPGPPQRASAVAGDARAIVTWAPPATTGSGPITHYEVVVIEDSGGGPAPLPDIHTVPSDQERFEATGLTNGTTYAFEVRAVNDVGPGAAATSNGVTPSEAPRPPGVPTAVVATAGDRSVTVTWAPPVEPVEVTSYRVTLEQQGGGGGPTTHVTGRDERAHTFDGLVNGETYVASVAAANDVGVGDPASSEPVTPAEPRPPGPPEDVAATPGSGRVTVVWAPPTDRGTSPINLYRIRWYEGGTLIDRAWPGAARRSFDITGLTNGTEYRIDVSARNDAGWSAPAEITATPQGTQVPGAPRNVVAVPGDGSATVSWQAPADPGDSQISGYEVRWLTGGTLIGSTNVGPAARNHTITSLINGTTYQIQVRARNGAGLGPPGSVTVTPRATPLPQPPGPPTNVTAVPGDRQATVSWQPPADSGDGPITGYRVEWSPGGRSQDLGAGARSYQITGLTNGTTYTVSVRARNASGLGPAVTTTVTPVPGGQPPGPVSIVLTPGDGEILVEWGTNGGGPVDQWEVIGDLAATEPGHIGQHLFTGLENGRRYTVQVRAINAYGSSTSPPASATPRGRADITITNMTTTRNSVTTTFTIDLNGTNPFQGCRIAVNGPGGFHQEQDRPFGCAEGSHTWTFNGLLADMPFTVSVWSWYSSDAGPRDDRDGRTQPPPTATVDYRFIIDPPDDPCPPIPAGGGAFAATAALPPCDDEPPLPDNSPAPVRSAPNQGASQVGTYGASEPALPAVCRTTGGSVFREGGGSSNVWVYLPDKGGYVNVVWLSGSIGNLLDCSEVYLG